MYDEKNGGEAESFSYVTERILPPAPKKRRPAWKIIIGFVLALIVLVFVVDYCLTKYELFGKRNKENHEQETSFVIPEAPSDEDKPGEEQPGAENETGNGSENTEQAETEELMRCLVHILVSDGEEKRTVSGVIVAVTQSAVLVAADVSSVNGADSIQLTFCSGESYIGAIKTQDNRHNLALLEVSMEDILENTLKNIRTPFWGSGETAEVGDEVIFVSFVSGYEPSVFKGTILSKAEEVIVDGTLAIIQTNLSYPGDGFLLDTDGNILGTVPYSENRPVIAAYSIDSLKETMENLVNGLPVPYLGIHGIAVTEEIKIGANESMPGGVYVKSVVMGSPAYKDGILNGDIIVKIGEQKVQTLSDLKKGIEQTKVGEPVIVTVMRQGTSTYNEYELEVVVGKEG